MLPDNRMVGTGGPVRISRVVRQVTFLLTVIFPSAEYSAKPSRPIINAHHIPLDDKSLV